MSEPRRSRRGRLYSGLLTILIVGVVGVAASALYLTTGGHLFGMTGGVFGLQAPRDSSGDVLARAREAAWAGRFPAAVAGYDSALVAAPDRALALERARVLGWAGRHDEAAAALAAVEDPADVETTLERARYLWWADRPTEADSLLSELLARRPGLAEAAELQDLIRPSIEPSARVAERWVRDRPDDPFSHLWLARALVAEGRRAPALAHYRATFGGAGSAEPEVLLEAAGVALGLDSLRFAGETLARYLNDVDPGDTTTRLRLARAYAWSGRYDRAEAEYRRVLAADPDPAVRRELASTLAAAGRHDAALDELARVLAVGEQRRDLLERARILALADRYGEAADALERAGTAGDAELELRRA
ncbi:MAG: tetratricopeptide repeat protein, partial [Gemmatimonadota bacterium]